MSGELSKGNEGITGESSEDDTDDNSDLRVARQQRAGTKSIDSDGE